MKYRRLNPTEIEMVIATHPRWQVQRGAFVATLKFEAFPTAIQFVREVADAAEKMNHHPDIDIRYTTLTFRVSTHDVGALTDKDADLVAAIDALEASKTLP